jgi:hypothetical protein
MKTYPGFVIVALSFTVACNKPAPSPAASNSSPSISIRTPDAVQQTLLQYSGANATNCGRFDVNTPADQLKPASDCAVQAAQSKHPFFVAYDMPGMAVGVAGNTDGKLFTVQAQGTGAAAAITSGACPAALRVASSGRITCFAPGDMGSMGGGHASGAMPPPGTANPHQNGPANPHTAVPKAQ